MKWLTKVRKLQTTTLKGPKLISSLERASFIHSLFSNSFSLSMFNIHFEPQKVCLDRYRQKTILKVFKALQPNSTETFQQSETARVISYTHGHLGGSLGIR